MSNTDILPYRVSNPRPLDRRSREQALEAKAARPVLAGLRQILHDPAPESLRLVEKGWAR